MDLLKEPFIICLLGPTATGKTAVSIEFSNRWPCEIISVDSAKIYCEMDIGTAKPPFEIRKKILHHLIDIRDPSEAYSAGEFLKDTEAAIKEIISKGKIPLLVGGTMMYFHVIKSGLAELPSADISIRNEILNLASKSGWNTLHAELEKIDPISYQKIKPTDKQRIQRALEIFYITGKPLSEMQKNIKTLPYRTYYFALKTLSKMELEQRMKERLSAMIKRGFIEEVERLHKRGDLNLNLPSIRSVGYKQIWLYLEGRIDYKEAMERIFFATRQLAKKQRTWMNQWQEIIYVDRDPNLACENIKALCQF